MSSHPFIEDLHHALEAGLSAEDLVYRHEGDWPGLMDTLIEVGESIGIQGADFVPAEPLMPLNPIGNLAVADQVPPVKLKVRTIRRKDFAIDERAVERWCRVFIAIYLARPANQDPIRADQPSTDSPDDAGTPPSTSAPPALGRPGPEA